MNNLLNYNLIGIGEFSHGIMESWVFRFNLLKYAIKNTDKNKKQKGGKIINKIDEKEILYLLIPTNN